MKNPCEEIDLGYDLDPRHPKYYPMYSWTNIQGELCAIPKMSTEYLLNCFYLLERVGKKHVNWNCRPDLIHELQKRGITP